MKRRTIQSSRRHAMVATAAAAVAVTAMATLAAGIAAAEDGVPVSAGGAERFVPADATAGAGTLVLRPRATVPSNEVRLKQICRWADDDAAAFAPIGELVVDHLDAVAGTKTLSIDAVRGLLRDAGVNLAAVNLGGSVACVVTRSEAPEPAAVVTPAEVERQAMLARWVEAKPAAVAVVGATKVPGTDGTGGAANECNAYHTLRDRLMADLSQRTNVPVERLQVAFDPADVHRLNLAEPTFRFTIDGRRVRDLGRVTYDVAIAAAGDGAATQKVTIACDARAWETQVVMARGAAYQAVLQEADVTERRALVDRLSDDGPALTKRQVVGQQAARDLRVGTVVTPPLVDPVPLARRGQIVTVTVSQGGVKVTTVARAMETGSFGQAIRVQNEETHDVYAVTLTGPLTADMGAPAAAGDARLAADRQ